MTRAGGPASRVALAVLALAGVAFLVLAAVLIPWDAAPRVAPVSPDEVFTPAQLAAGEEYARWARVWGWSSLAVSLAVTCWLGFTDVGRRLVARLRGPWWAVVVQAVVLVGLAGRVATLPLAVAAQQHRRDAGLSLQGWAAWSLDVAKGELVTAVATSAVLLVLVGAARRWHRWWPATVAGTLAALVLLASFAYPLLVEPLFNRFEPMPDGELRTRILQVAQEEGVQLDPDDGVLVADASRRTTTLNAYVSGYGGSRRVVVYDTLVDGLDEDEAVSVVAHELAHARHDDVLVGTLIGALGAATAVGALGVVLARMRRSPADVAVVPLVLALAAVGSLAVATPVQNLLSRQVETRADVDALRTTGDGAAFERMQVELALRSRADVTPPAWSQAWFGSHPTTMQRIALARGLAVARP